MKKFKKIETEIRNILKKMRPDFYEIARRCVVLFNAQDDYADEIGIEPEKIPEHLNSMFLRDFAVDLGDVITLLKVFPDKESWNRPLLDILEDAKEKVGESAGNDRQHQSTRRSVRLKDLESVESKLEDAEYQLGRQAQSMSELRSENEDLKRENARLEGRIQELERLLSRTGETTCA